MHSNSSASSHKPIPWLFFVLTISLFFLGSNVASGNQPKKTTPKPPDPIAIAHARIVEVLNDPESARFRNSRPGRGGTVCGEYNAKNSMGGYVGFRAFIVFPDRVLLENRENAAAIEYRWLENCEAEPASQ
jgi:hypothetical protein